MVAASSEGSSGVGEVNLLDNLPTWYLVGRIGPSAHESSHRAAT